MAMFHYHRNKKMKPPEQKGKKSNDMRERLDKMNLVLHWLSHAGIDLLTHQNIIREAIRKERKTLEYQKQIRRRYQDK